MRTQRKHSKINRQGLWLLSLAVSGLLGLNPKAQAQTKAEPQPAATATPDANTDKIDVGNLEQKYWSAKDDDFTVVQNRTYTKAKKISVGLLTGRLINDGFLEGSPSSLSLGYFLNERHGLSLDYTTFSTKENSVTKKFVSTYAASPAYNKPLETTSLTYMWSPIYAKVSLLEQKILYLDMSIGIHLGTSKYRIMTIDGGLVRSTSHYGIDISQLWFIQKWIALRFDIRNTWSKQKQYLYHKPGTEPESERYLGTSELQDNTWVFGVNFFF